MRLLAKKDTPSDWDSNKIGYYVEKHKGGAPLRPSDFSEEGFPVIPKKAIQLGNELIIRNPTYCTNEFAESNKRSIVDSSYTITTLRDLVPTGPTIGTVVNFYSNERYILSQGVYGLKLSKKIDRNYFAYLSNTSFYRKIMQRTMVGSTQVHIRTPEYMDLKIQTPPLPEQRKIAKILSTWDKAIASTEKLIAVSQQQKKSLMQQLLTGKKRLINPETGMVFEGDWEEVKLANYSVIIMGSSPKSESYNEMEEGLPLLQGNADIKQRKSAPRIYTSQITKECSVGDILLSVRAPVGSIAKSMHHACIGRGIASLKAKKGYSQEYLYQWLLGFEPKWEQLSQGSTFESVNSNDIKTLHLSIPSFDEQQKIASVLTAADKEIELLQAKLAHLKQEKKALMQQLLTGKSRVKVDDKEVA